MTVGFDTEAALAEQRELKERVVEINRVAKVVKGGRRFSFTALVVIGDEVDRVGVGYGKAREVPLAISKAVDDAKKNLFVVPKKGSTITHEVIGQSDAARVLLRPASEGTGVIAGGGVRAVLELAGIRDILAKSLGNPNPINLLKATVTALQALRRPEEVAQMRGKEVADVVPRRRRRQEEAEAAAPAPSLERADNEEPGLSAAGEEPPVPTAASEAVAERARAEAVGETEGAEPVAEPESPEPETPPAAEPGEEPSNAVPAGELARSEAEEEGGEA